MRFFCRPAILPILLAATALQMAHAAPAPERWPERWEATSSTAMAITGDIILSPTRLVAARRVFPLMEVAQVKDFRTDSGPQPARILKVAKPVNPPLLHGNKLCGPPVQWIVTYQGADDTALNVVAFTGAAQPSGENSPGLCATYLYSRPAVVMKH